MVVVCLEGAASPVSLGANLHNDRKGGGGTAEWRFVWELSARAANKSQHDDKEVEGSCLGTKRTPLILVL